MRRPLYLLALLLLLPSLLVNLGLMVFIDDEAIRSLVAQEMLWSGNFIAPEMHGDAYLNKPPLWNWVLALSFALHGEASEWAARFPTVLCLLGFAATVFYWSRKHFSSYLAFVHALTVVTCGRMLFWDSMLALIDVSFSWVVYLQIMVLYHYGSRGDWWRAFLLSYLLTATGFMLKNLPAIVFQGLSVFAVLGWTRSWRQFFRPAHLISGLLCVGLLALYYWQYGSYVKLEWVVERLLTESGKRTVAAHSWWESVSHVLAFPFEMSYHFLPWTIFSLLFFVPGAWAKLKTNDFAAFSLVAFLVNIPVYWLSPEVYPRYLLMLFPLQFGASLYLFTEFWRARKGPGLAGRAGGWLVTLLRGLMWLVAPLVFFVPFVPETALVTLPWLKSFGCGLLLLALAYLGSQRANAPNLLLIFTCFLLGLRLVFNFFVLPPRAAGDERGIAVRETARSVAATAKDRELAIYGFTLIEPATGFYLTQARGRVVPRQWEGFDSTTVYVTSPLQYPELGVVAVDSLYKRHLRMRYPVGTFLTPPEARARKEPILRDGMGTGF